MNYNTFLTNPENAPSKQLMPSTIISMYEKLHNSINEMHRKVEHTISKQESQFLFAYRNHIIRIKKELEQIKKKSEEQEKMFTSNDRIKFLEKELAVMREETIKVYNKLQKTAAELEIYRKKYEDTNKARIAAESRAKDMMKGQKMMEVDKDTLLSTIKELEEKIKEKDGQIESQTKLYKPSFSQKGSIRRELLNQTSLTSSDRYYQGKKSSLIEASFRKSFRIRDSRESGHLEHNQYQQYFLECLKSVKKEISYRNGGKMDYNQINNLEQFRQVDKIKVLELFLSNSKLESWMFEKVSLLKYENMEEREREKGTIMNRSLHRMGDEREITGNGNQIRFPLMATQRQEEAELKPKLIHSNSKNKKKLQQFRVF